MEQKKTSATLRTPPASSAVSVAAVALVALALTQPSQALAVNWEQQAERLERISASLLDAVPIVSPPTTRFGLGVSFDVSFLPKPNPRIGAKSEKVPSAPVHTVPTVKGYALFDLTKKMKLGVNAYAGYLVPGLEGIVGVKAKLSQYTVGASTTLVHALTPMFSGTADLGLHLTGGTLKGAITAPDAKDTFTFSTMMFYVAPGFLLPKWGVFGNMLLGYKSTTAELKIPADDTDLKTKDTLSDAPAPIVAQFSAGWRHKTGIEAGLAYLFVPARLYMPRLHIAWIYPLGAKSQSPVAGKATRTDKETGGTAAEAGARTEAADGVAPAPASEDPAAATPASAKAKSKETAVKKTKSSKARRKAPAGDTPAADAPAPEAAP